MGEQQLDGDGTRVLGPQETKPMGPAEPALAATAPTVESEHHDLDDDD